MFSRDGSKRRPRRYFAWGCFRDFGEAWLVASVRLRPRGFGATAFARFAWNLWHGLAEPKRAKAGGPGRTRTCNQTVMSDGTSISIVDFAVVSFAFDRVCCASFRSFLVRNWCGSSGGRLPEVLRLRIPLLDQKRSFAESQLLTCCDIRGTSPR